MRARGGRDATPAGRASRCPAAAPARPCACTRCAAARSCCPRARSTARPARSQQLRGDGRHEALALELGARAGLPRRAPDGRADPGRHGLSRLRRRTSRRSSLGRRQAWVLPARLRPRTSRRPSSCARAGSSPSEIAVVVMTHLHNDHASGATQFPDATFVVDGAEWGAACKGGFAEGYRHEHFDQPLDWRTVDYDARARPRRRSSARSTSSATARCGCCRRPATRSATSRSCSRSRRPRAAADRRRRLHPPRDRRGPPADLHLRRRGPLPPLAGRDPRLRASAARGRRHLRPRRRALAAASARLRLSLPGQPQPPAAQPSSLPRHAPRRALDAARLAPPPRSPPRPPPHARAIVIATGTNELVLTDVPADKVVARDRASARRRAPSRPRPTARARTSPPAGASSSSTSRRARSPAASTSRGAISSLALTRDGTRLLAARRGAIDVVDTATLTRHRLRSTSRAPSPAPLAVSADGLQGGGRARQARRPRRPRRRCASCAARSRPRSATAKRGRPSRPGGVAFPNSRHAASGSARPTASSAASTA